MNTKFFKASLLGSAFVLFSFVTMANAQGLDSDAVSATTGTTESTISADGQDSAANLVNSTNSATSTTSNNSSNISDGGEEEEAQLRYDNSRFKKRTIWDDIEMPERVFKNIPEGQ